MPRTCPGLKVTTLAEIMAMKENLEGNHHHHHPRKKELCVLSSERLRSLPRVRSSEKAETEIQACLTITRFTTLS